MRAVAWLRWQCIPRPPGSMKGSIGIFAKWIPSLDEKFRDNPMKGRSIKKIHFGKVDKILHVAWSIICEKAKLNRTKRSGNGRLSILFFKLNGWGTRHSERDCIKGESNSARSEIKGLKILTECSELIIKCALKCFLRWRPSLSLCEPFYKTSRRMLFSCERCIIAS